MRKYIETVLASFVPDCGENGSGNKWVNRLTPVNITIHHTIQYQRTRTRRLFPGPALHSRREPHFGGALLAHLRETRNVDPKADLLEWAPAFSIAASHPKGSASRICNSRSL